MTEPRRVVLAGTRGGGVGAAFPILEHAGYALELVDTQEALEALAQRPGPPAHLVILDEAFGPEGGVAACRKLRGNAAWHPVSLMLVVPAGQQHLEECLVSGINDFILDPFPADELLEKVARLTVIPTRRELNTLARVTEPRSGRSHVGRTLNLSENGVLIEIDGPIPVGRQVLMEFMLPDEAEPLSVKARVIRRATELDLRHPAFGIRFVEMSEPDRAKVDAFLEKRARAARDEEP